MTDSRIRLALKSREDFAGLSLHDKNDYLQALARQFCDATGRPIVTLDKDALGRLRRFYSRRRLADLRLNELPDNDLGRALRGLGEAIKNVSASKIWWACSRSSCLAQRRCCATRQSMTRN
jgi:hypothetical protein